MTWPVAGLMDAKTRSVVTSSPSISSRRSGPRSVDGLLPTVTVAACCDGIRSPQHVDNSILIPGESYIPTTRIQPNGRNETAILAGDIRTRGCGRHRRLGLVSEPSCECPQRESKVLVFGREILCA